MKLAAVLFCITCLFSCEKNINFKIKVIPDVLVVDAVIENNQSPIVVLSKSFDYFSKITPQSLDTLFVHDADIFISNGILTQKLREYSIDSTGFHTYFYSVDTSNIPASFAGQFNTTYNLKIVVAGKEYTSTTTIPSLTKKIDSLWWKPAPFSTDTSEVIVMVRATDPPCSW